MDRRSVLILLLPLLGFGCQPTGPSRPGETFDAGPLFADRTPVLVHRFQVRNTTGKTVRILGETHSCTCTEVRIPKVRLEPGQWTELEMKVNIYSSYADLALSCTVQTDHPRFKEWTYWLKYTSYPRVRMASDRVVLRLSPMSEEQTSSPRPTRLRFTGETWLETYASEGGDLPVPLRVDPVDGLTIVLARRPELDALDGGVQRARYRVQLAAMIDEDGAMTGTQSLPVNVRASGGLNAGAMAVWTFRGPVECEPSRVFFGLVTPDKLPRRRSVLLRAADGKPFRLLSLEGADGPIRAIGGALPTLSAPEHALDLVLSAPSDASGLALSGTVRVRTDRGPLPVVLVPWSVFFHRSGSPKDRLSEGRIRAFPTHEETLR